MTFSYTDLVNDRALLAVLIICLPATLLGLALIGLVEILARLGIIR